MAKDFSGDTDDLLSILQQIEDGDENPIDTDNDDESIESNTNEVRDLQPAAIDPDEVAFMEHTTGNLDEDIKEWYVGDKSLPTKELVQYVSGFNDKTDVGTRRTILSNFEMMGNLRNYITNSIPLVFDIDASYGLDPEELEEKLKLAFSMYKELSGLNLKTSLAISEQQKKYNNSDDTIDKLTMLLSSIPSDKLEKLLKELSNL